MNCTMPRIRLNRLYLVYDSFRHDKRRPLLSMTPFSLRPHFLYDPFFSTTPISLRPLFLYDPFFSTTPFSLPSGERGSDPQCGDRGPPPPAQRGHQGEQEAPGGVHARDLGGQRQQSLPLAALLLAAPAPRQEARGRQEVDGGGARGRPQQSQLPGVGGPLGEGRPETTVDRGLDSQHRPRRQGA